MRIPIQIAVGEQGNVYALCSDGTLWRYQVYTDRPEWKELQRVPLDNLVDLKLQEPVGTNWALKNEGPRWIHQGFQLTEMRRRLEALKSIRQSKDEPTWQQLWSFIEDLDAALVMNGH